MFDAVHMSDDARQLFVTLTEEVFNRGNFDVADDLVLEDFYNHEAPDSPGPEGFKASARWPSTGRAETTSASSPNLVCCQSIWGSSRTPSRFARSP